MIESTNRDSEVVSCGMKIRAASGAKKIRA